MYLYKQITLNINKEVRNTLQDIYGVGWFKSIKVCSKVGFSYPLSFTSINNFYYVVLSSSLDFCTLLEVRIKRFVFENIKRCFDIQCYKGIRHNDSLPVRGQRTRTNASTKKRINYKFKSKQEVNVGKIKRKNGI